MKSGLERDEIVDTENLEPRSALQSVDQQATIGGEFRSEHKR
jgi:hypothetical protein